MKGDVCWVPGSYLVEDEIIIRLIGTGPISNYEQRVGYSPNPFGIPGIEKSSIYDFVFTVK
jgi:hypothetical protein